jgi:Intron-binding protein aquarius N-terminus
MGPKRKVVPARKKKEQQAVSSADENRKKPRTSKSSNKTNFAADKVRGEEQPGGDNNNNHEEQQHNNQSRLALIVTLYETCVLSKEQRIHHYGDNSNSHNHNSNMIMEAEQQQQRALVQADDRGVLRQTVWPCLVQEFQNNSSRNNNKATSDDHDSSDKDHATATATTTTTLWFRLCHLTAVLLSWQCREGNVTQQTLAFLTVHPPTAAAAAAKEEEENQTQNSSIHKQAWMACIQTLCACPRQDWNYRTTMVHFLGVVWNAASGGGDVIVSAGAPVGGDDDDEKDQNGGGGGEDDSNNLLYHVGGTLRLWHWMPQRRRELELRRRPHLQWRKHADDDDKKKYGHNNDESPPFIVKVLNQVISLVDGDAFKLGHYQKHAQSMYVQQDEDQEDEEQEEHQTTLLAQWIFLHRSLELLIDLLSSVDVRPYLVPYLSAIHFSIACRTALGISTYSQTTDENLFLAQQLLERIDRLQHFPVRDHVNRSTSTSTSTIAASGISSRGTDATTTAMATALSKVEVASLYHRRASTLQKMCHRYYADALADVVFSGVGLLCSDATFVRRVLGGFPDHDLLELLHKMRLVDKTHGGKEIYSRDFLLLVLLDYLIQPADPLEDLQSFPLYPTESVLWDFARIPPGHSGLLPASHVLSLPKLHAQFLSYADYLWRNFELMRLESAYEIRSDLVDVIRRVRPLIRQTMAMDEHGNEQVALQTEFTGWARMALEMDGALKITRVEKPLLGTNHPSKVVAEITIDLKSCGDSIRREWDALGEFDNLFLVAIDAGKMSGALAPLLREYHMHHGNHRQWDTDGDRRVQDEDDRTFRQRYGVMLVRGCMILQVRDEEGIVLSDPGASKDARPKGTKRIYRVAIDPAQFSQDARSQLGSGLYQSLNLVVRRHGRENNFKAILETTRSLMAGAGSVNRVIPPWLQPLLLGQGHPANAAYKSSVVQAYAKKTVGVANPDSFLDYGDTFLDEAHLVESFPGSKVVVDGKSGPEEQKGSSPEQQELRRRCYRVRVIETDGQTTVDATSYSVAESVQGNPVRFTPRQVAAIRSGLSCGLTLVIGPPGTGYVEESLRVGMSGLRCCQSCTLTQLLIAILCPSSVWWYFAEKLMLLCKSSPASIILFQHNELSSLLIPTLH